MRCGNACQLERIAAACAGAPRQPCAAIRVPPPSRCVGPGVLAGKNRAVCIPISPNARNGPSSWQHPPEMHAFRDQDGNIFALCIHFQAQSGDSGYMARESCRQGAFFASRGPKSCMARRCCQRRPAFPRQRPVVRPNGLCAAARPARLPHARASAISPALPRRPCAAHALAPAAPAAPPADIPAPHRPAARAPPRFPQFPRNSAVIQLPIQENSVSKDKQ